MGPTAKKAPVPFAFTDICKAYRDMKRDEREYWEQKLKYYEEEKEKKHRDKYTHYEESRWFIPYANRPFTQGPIIQPDKPKNDDLPTR